MDKNILIYAYWNSFNHIHMYVLKYIKAIEMNSIIII